jgi:hypothetical protein
MFFLIVGATLAVVFGGAAAAQNGTGLYGLVLISPAYPVCEEGAPCTRPAGGVLLQFSRAGHRVAATRTRANGTFRVALTPGKYVVSTPARKRMSRLNPRTATAHTRYGRANFTLDIGIR